MQVDADKKSSHKKAQEAQKKREHIQTSFVPFAPFRGSSFCCPYLRQSAFIRG